MHVTRLGSGPPLLLIHGLGGTWRSWETILPALSAEREVIAVDLPGFGATPPLSGEVSIRTLANALVAFLEENDLVGVDVAGASMGARLALELSRRGVVGATVALDPGGFWTRREVRLFGGSVALSIRLIRTLQPLLPFLTGNPVTRTLLFAQFSARPWRIPADVALHELRSYAASASFDAALHSLVHGPPQEGAPAGSTEGPVVIGWGRRDWVCFPTQAKRAQSRFPDAHLQWFEHSGHFPYWDMPAEASRLILETTSSGQAEPGARTASPTASASEASRRS